MTRRSARIEDYYLQSIRDERGYRRFDQEGNELPTFDMPIHEQLDLWQLAREKARSMRQTTFDRIILGGRADQIDALHMDALRFVPNPYC